MIYICFRLVFVTPFLMAVLTTPVICQEPIENLTLLFEEMGWILRVSETQDWKTSSIAGKLRHRPGEQLNLEKLGNLKQPITCECSLTLTATTIPDEEIIHLRSFKQLTTLNLAYAKISDAAIKELSQSHKKIRWLELQRTSISNKSLQFLGDMPNLEELSLGGTKIAGGGMQHISNLKKLRFLNLRGTPVNDEDIASLKGLESLRVLYLDSTNVTDDGLQAVGQIPNLEVLFLNSCRVSDKGMAHLASLRNLQRIQLLETDVAGDGMKHLKRIPGLKVEFPNRLAQALQKSRGFDAARSDIQEIYRSKAYLGFSENGGQLEVNPGFLFQISARVNNSNFGDNELLQLGEIPGIGHLTRLQLGKTKLSVIGLRSLRNYHKLSFLSLKGTSVDSKGLRVLAELSNVRTLDLSNSGIEDKAINETTFSHALTYLNLSDNPISDEGLSNTGGLKGLKALDLSQTNVSGSGFQAKHWPSLAALKLDGTAVTADSVFSLVGISELRSLSLNDTAIGDQGLEQLVRLKKLQNLELRNSGITDKGLKVLLSFPDLAALDIRGNTFSSNSIEQLKVLPNLSVLRVEE